MNCARVGCNNEVVLNKYTTNKRYCSRRCQYRVWCQSPAGRAYFRRVYNKPDRLRQSLMANTATGRVVDWHRRRDLDDRLACVSRLADDMSLSWSLDPTAGLADILDVIRRTGTIRAEYRAAPSDGCLRSRAWSKLEEIVNQYNPYEDRPTEPIDCQSNSD